MNPAVSVTGLPEWKKIQSAFAANGLSHVFIELLGWSAAVGPVIPVTVDGNLYNPTILADLRGYKIFFIETPDMPPPKVQARLDSELSAQAPERITIISDGKNLQWRWPHHTPNGGVSFETLSVSATVMPSFLAQRLVGLKFGAQDFASGLSIVDVRDRVRGRFDGAKVTKKFFDEFRKRHQHLAENIQGLELELDRSTYATLLMNRLMLLYFLQKREFLNEDPQYLENCLRGVQSLSGTDKFYGFYRDLLLPMFFDRLASFAQKSLPPEISVIIGDIPYINGGIYEPSRAERDYAESLNVPDEVFDQILQFFGRFNWHLDTRPSGSENEINPEVIGYIFEQYINYTAGGKKDNGAYYTKEDVTGYMVGATLVPRVLDYLVELSIPFKDLVTASPHRYIYADMLHGFEAESGRWLTAPADLVKVWKDDPIHWHVLDDAEVSPEINLPGETWVETLYRRERVEELLAQLGGGLVQEVNDLVSHNLNARLLLTDAIDRVERPDLAVELWKRVTALTVLDPTCGSGAFLFAAMEALEDVYHHLIDVMKSESQTSPEAAAIVAEIGRHPNDRYFVRKSIALNNLYGTDLMQDAIETAQLRIFLALVSCLESKEELEPLPDLDFNLKCGNLLVGFYDAEDIDRFGGDFLNQIALDNLRPQIENYKSAYREFVVMSTEGTAGESSVLKLELEHLSVDLRSRADVAFAELDDVKAEGREDWVLRYRPFHWFIEFPEIIERGGFDVIVGNPPYVARRHLSDEERRQIASMRTGACPDLYAPCFERSLRLVRGDGRQALIVMLNLVFGDKFSALRFSIGDRGGAEWWSTYGSFAGGLFSGVEVRNTIVILGPGAGIRSTHHMAFGVERRHLVFALIRYHQIARAGSDRPLRGGVVTKLAEQLQAETWDTFSASSPPSGESVYLRPTAGYWVPVMPRPLPLFSESFEIMEDVDSGLIELRLYEAEDSRAVVSALGGKVGYFWWFSIGDNFHVNAHETFAVRALLGRAQRVNQRLETLAEGVHTAIPRAVVFISHMGIRANIRWSDLWAETDLFDKLLLETVGMVSEWRNLNVWYRQAMRSSGPSPKDRVAPEGLARSMTKP